MPGDSLTVSTTIALPPDRAFELFTAGMASWWPREYTWSQDVLEEILIEPGEGGFCVERGPHGFTDHWGRVETWEPPERLVFTWQIGPHREPVPDPNRASEVEVHFSAAGNTETNVELEHRHFSRYVDDGGAYRDAMASAQGWPHILDRFSA